MRKPAKAGFADPMMGVAACLDDCDKVSSYYKPSGEKCDADCRCFLDLKMWKRKRDRGRPLSIPFKGASEAIILA